VRAACSATTARTLSASIPHTGAFGPSSKIAKTIFGSAQMAVDWIGCENKSWKFRVKMRGCRLIPYRSVCEDATDTIWVITQNGDVVNNSGGSWKTISSSSAWTGGVATCVACDRQGIVWIGTFSHGLYRWQDGKFTGLRRADGLAQASIRSLLADSRGNLWIAFSVGDILQCLRDGQFKNFDLPPDSRPIRAFAEDVAGNIWMANLDMRLLRVQGDKIIDETDKTSEPLSPNPLPRHHTGWLVMDRLFGLGLGRLKDGHFAKIGREEGLKDDSICSVTPDNRGWMWFGSDHGIFRSTVAECLPPVPIVTPGSHVSDMAGMKPCRVCRVITAIPRGRAARATEEFSFRPTRVSLSFTLTASARTRLLHRYHRASGIG